MDSEFIKTIFNYGLPAGLLVLFLLGVYRLAYTAGAFLAPIVKDLTGQHIQTMNTFETVGKGLLQQSEAQTALLKSSGPKIDEIREEVVQRKGK